jgi:hypothetical protein
MLTPSRYWRIAASLADLQRAPPREFVLPCSLTQQTTPPTVGDGLLLADYESTAQTGVVRYLGIILSRSRHCVEVEWLPTNTEIWIDTPAGRGNWSTKEGFRFAATKVAGYGLHQLFSDTFPNLEPRESLPGGARAVPAARRPTQRPDAVSRERLDPAEIIGEPTGSPRGGWVYVLQSAYGFKVGRTRNVPSRMRAFGVKLPIMYAILLCAWFDDHIEAESAYHRQFTDKRINGEWFDLQEQDLALIRSRQYDVRSVEGQVLQSRIA